MNDQLTFDDLRAYRAGQLSTQARHRVERLLLENPFYADALAGLEAMQQTATPTTEQLAELRTALHERIHESATRKRLWPLWIATTTAVIIFMLAIAIYFIFFASPRPVRPKTAPSAHATAQLMSTLTNAFQRVSIEKVASTDSTNWFIIETVPVQKAP
jgi:anti-sigma factor RsiW